MGEAREIAKALSPAQGDIRIILWNALKAAGVGEAFIYPVIDEAAPKLASLPSPSQGLTIPDELREALERVRLEDELRSCEGESVTIVSDNQDFNGQPDRLVICEGEWTDWEERRFPGETVIDCLRQAVEARRQALSDQEKSQ